MAITVTAMSPTFWTADYQITGLDTARRYDLIRIMATGTDSERRYSIVGWRRDWRPATSTVFLRDYEAPLRPYYVALYDSSGVTPADWNFVTGPYAGPAAVQLSGLITPAPPADCGAILRSGIQPELVAQVKLAGDATVQYPARYGEHKVIGAKYPVFVVDRREGRRSDGLIIYTPDAYSSELVRQVLLPDTGRLYPMWLRTSDDDSVWFHDLYFIPRDISVQPATKARPWAKFWSVAFTEIDPRSIVPRIFPDGATQAALPSARITTSVTSGKAPLTVTFTDASTGSIESRKWDFSIGQSKYGTGTKAVETVTYKEPGSYRIRLTVSGPGGKDNDEVYVRVTK